jgi:tRNA (guanine-N7-)-methyltransferase
VSRRLKTDIPGPDRRVSLEEAAERGWDAVFAGDLAPPLRLVVEIGFGRGEFLMDLARREPATAFVGVELSHKRVLKMARRLAKTEIGNVRLVEGRGERLVEEALAPGSVSAFWINFPDPWPKKRHHRRRIVQPGFVHELVRRLVPGGELHVATDDPDYAAWIDEVLAGEPGLENVHAPRPHVREVPGRMRTAYELEWRQKGRVPHFWTFRRRDARSSARQVDAPAGRG